MMCGDPISSIQVILRPISDTDLSVLFQHQLDPEANRMAVVHPRPRIAFDAHWSMCLANPEVWARAIIADGDLVGQISCFPMDGRRCVGYWVAREWWGRGVATRALGLLLEEVAARPMHARAARSNAASIRVLERCGFVVTGYEWSEATDRWPACEEALLRLG